MTRRPAYQRILLKLSGEALLGPQQFGIDLDACGNIANSVSDLIRLGVQVGLVIGGGNIFRGVKAHRAGMARVPADQIGMLATIINGVALQQALEKIHCKARVMTAISFGEMFEPYSWQKALDYLQKGEVLIFVGGTGNPYFSTDSAAALRALEIQANLLIKATKVDGVYEQDPLEYPDAAKFDRISYSEVLSRQLNVMDAAAIALCRENRLPIRVVNIFQNHALEKAVCNEPVGTLVE